MAAPSDELSLTRTQSNWTNTSPRFVTRNELSLITPADAFHIHNGPVYGKFMDWPGHPAVQPLTDGPTAQWVYMVYGNQGVKDRTRWVRVTELETTQDY